MSSLRTFAAFMNDAVGLEKSLRITQATLMTLASLTVHYFSSYQLQNFVVARNHIALARRYFRLWKWIDFGHLAYSRSIALKLKGSNARPQDWLQLAESTILAAYFLIEAVTLTNAMGLTHSSWLADVDQFAQKLWFYAISVSVMISLEELLLGRNALGGSASGEVKVNDKLKTEKEADGRMQILDKGQTVPPDRSRAMKQLLSDCCDLTIPAYFVDWIKVDLAVVGLAMTVSSWLAIRDIWSHKAKQQSI